MSFNVNNWTERVDQGEVDVAFASVNYFQAKPLTRDEANEVAYYCYLYSKGLITKTEMAHRVIRVVGCGREEFEYFFANAASVRREYEIASQEMPPADVVLHLV